MFYNKCVAYWYHEEQYETTNSYYLLKISTTTHKHHKSLKINILLENVGMA